MKAIGLDIGTTTVSSVLYEDGRVLHAITRPNDSALPSDRPWEKLQDPGRILEIALGEVEELTAACPEAACIGVTGQMHGIVYLDRDARPVSPLYTWQDGRGNLPLENGESAVERLHRLTGYDLATGYGLVTHYYNSLHGTVSGAASSLVTIHDFIAMSLAGRTSPLTDASDAASFGFFRGSEGCWDRDAIRLAGMDDGILPEVAEDPLVGLYRGRIPVYAAIGDNQASFLGATGGQYDAMLVNVGTGSQFSVYSGDYLSCAGLETRPFPCGGYLIVGASLCGGRAFALLESFFRDVAEKMTGEKVGNCYPAMDRLLLSSGEPEDVPEISPLFQGTRQDPSLRGTIGGLSTDNMTAAHFLHAMIRGMAGELYDMYLRYLENGGERKPLYGSGNGLRKNLPLQRCFADLFRQAPRISDCVEEAACGAAIYGLSCLRGSS